MKMSNEKMLESALILAGLNECGMLGYAIARNRRILSEEVQDYSRKRDELLREFGQDVGGGKYELQPENAAKFFDALKPYSELTADVDVMQISPEIFCGGNLTSGQMYVLDWMVISDGN